MELLSRIAFLALLALSVSCTRREQSTATSPPPKTREAASLAAPAPAPLTYWGSVAPIMAAHCTSCHAEGGIGPMSLTSFADVKTHLGEVVLQAGERHMPPWLPDTKSCATLTHSRAMTEEEIATLKRWADAGAPEGTSAEYRKPEVKETFAALPEKPDRVVSPPIGYTPKVGRADDYHCFVLDPKLTKPERVVGLRIAPGLPAVVHHVLLFEVRANAVPRVERLDEAEPGAGYTCFGGIGVTPTVRAGNLAKGELVDFDAQMIVGWAPGAGATDVAGAPTKLPEGTAIKLTPGSRLVMQVHYSLENYNRQARAEDRTRVDMWLAPDGEFLKQAVWVPLLKYDFRVPKDAAPTDPRATAKADIELPLPLEVRGVAPHMHLRGRSIQVSSGSDCLLDVPRWDFHHQEGYWLERSVPVKRATLTCQWDNRPNAQPIVNGKRKPSHELHWGEGTDDEMCLAFLYATL
ncbi:MAG: hypothetical protein U0270_18075 [Labilithrix sp.]